MEILAAEAWSTLGVIPAEDVQLRLFGKPEVHGHRRFGVLLATADSVEHALEKVEEAYNCVLVSSC